MSTPLPDVFHMDNLSARMISAAEKDKAYGDSIYEAAVGLANATTAHCLDNTKDNEERLLAAWAKARRVYSLFTGKVLCVD